MHSAQAFARALSDTELLRRLAALVTRERHATVEVIAHLAELDRRRLHRAEGYGSLFKYCTQALRFSEPAAYRRIVAARCARRFAGVLERLGSGDLTLAVLCVVVPHLTSDNVGMVLEEVAGKTKREAEGVVARLFPREDVPDVVRKLPAPRALPPLPALAPAPLPDAPVVALLPAASPTIVAPLAPERYRVQFTISKEAQERLRQAQDLMRRELPDGDLGEIFDRALCLLVQDLVRRKAAVTPNPRARRGLAGRSRHVPAAVKREVWLRDGGRCAFVARNGRRCEERSFLEFHHVDAYALGGETTAANIALRCRAHNAYEAELVFGPRSPAVSERRETYAATLVWGSRFRPNTMGSTRPGTSF